MGFCGGDAGFRPPVLLASNIKDYTLRSTLFLNIPKYGVLIFPSKHPKVEDSLLLG